MRFLENFWEFLDSGVVRKRNPDKLRAESLISDAKRRRKFVDDIFEKVGLKKENANYFIENVYDILIELIRARMLIEGFQAF
ncbi:hypothetical protein COX58_00885 [archaeon CG_4_10_14_0_2_um_filter_Archaea_38_6]|nr:MAG: hypothetical protein COS83_04550 [archaeon CG07_land_8_20_14_0_80_38_8]PIU88675.1 MAG: hypothetical protein COS64_02875 [archaeon CG06_land_8_20_14_3_00_37_11]PJA22913.1 MAG: hypothetical protein COX58_00885 [archaeon CG_4_10_14_0_2_um_filter_Archaea_38_6]